MTKSALRVLDILEFIAEQRHGSTHTHIAQSLRIPKSSLTALLRDLVSRGYLELDADTGRYGIGAHALTLSQAYLRNLNLVRVAQPVVSEIFDAVGEFASFGIPRGADYVIICAESMPLPLAYSLQIGERGPLFCSATGKAILAFMSDDQCEAALAGSTIRRITPSTKTELGAIRAELAEVRLSRVAYAREENIAGVNAIAAPVFNAAGMVVGALAVAAPVSRFTPALEATAAKALRGGARRLSQQLGWREAA